MSRLLTHLRLVIATLALVVLAAAAVPAAAQQPSSVNPTASSVKEDQLLREMPRIQGRGTIPDVKSYVLEQPAGRDWRRFHEQILPRIGVVAILAMLALLVAFYLTRGMVRIDGGRSGLKLVRFSGFERFVHWMTASCFIILALTGLNITFGKTLLLPVLGADAFSDWSQAAKYAHNYLSFPFTLGVVVILGMWIAWQVPNASDVKWLMEGGGLIGKTHAPAGRFNGGQKIFYWAVVIGGTTVASTGFLMMFPFYLLGISGMQSAQMVHGIAAMLFVAVMLAHIYIGTIGMEGAFEGMGTGEVDLNWAKQHHNRWVADQLAKGRVSEPPHGAAATPAE
jgi:formate dehydrogenase subunit gamma